MADEAQIANRIGLGVETVDPGNAAINKLRDVRREMSAIVALSEKMGRIRTPTATGRAGGSQGAKQEVEEQGRLFSDGVARQQSLFSRAEAEKTRIFQTNSRRRVRTAEEEIARVEEIEIRAQQRRAIREEVRFKQRLSSTPAREQARREAELTTDAQERIDRATRRTEVSRREAELGLTNRYGAQGGQTGALNRALAAQQERVATQAARQEAEQLAAEQSRAGLDRAVGGGRNALAGVLARAQQQRLQRQLEEERTYRNNVARGRAAFAGVLERSGEDEGTGRRLQQQAEESEQGAGGGGGGGNNTTAGAVQRIVRNMAIRAAIFYSIYNLKKFAEDSTEAARIAAQTERQLEATSKMGNSAFLNNLRVAESLRQSADLSRTEAQATTSNVARFAAGVNRRVDTGRFTQAAADLAAARGVENKELPAFVERLRSGSTEEALGKSREELIKEYATAQVQNRVRLPSNLIVGPESRPKFQSQAQEVAAYTEKLTEAQKQEIVFNETLRQGGEVAGEVERRHNSMEGALDRTSARWADAKTAVGNFIEGFTPLQSLLKSVSELINGVDTDKLRLIGTGINGQITPGDVAANARARQQNLAGRASREFDAYGFGVGGELGLLALARYGPGTVNAGKKGVGAVAGGFKSVARRLTGSEAEAAEAEGAEAAGAGVAGITGIGTVLILATTVITGMIRKAAEEKLAQMEAEVGAENQKILRQREDLNTGQGYYRLATGPNIGGHMTEQFTEAQMRDAVKSGRFGRGQFEFARESDEQFNAEQDRAGKRKAALEQEAKDREEFWNRVEADEGKHRQRIEQAQEGALAKLREFRQGSFRVVEEVAQQTTDRDNPFVKIATDFTTSAQRMQEQWGFLGKTTAAYFTDLEQGAIKVRYLEEHFKALTGAMELTNKAEAEMDERRLSPELTREEQATGRLTGSMIRLAQTLPGLQADYRRVFQGVAPTRIENERALKAQVQELERVRNLGVGQDEQGRREVNRQVDEAVLGITSRFTAQQIRNTPWLREAFRGANLGQQSELVAQVEDDRKRIEIQANERRRITEDAQRAIEFRRTTEQGIYANAVKENRGTMFQGQFVGTLTANERRLISKGGDLADEALIRFTEKLSPREMGSQLFGERNEAIRRQADRQLAHEAEALAAAQEAVEIQRNILGGLNGLRDAILSGSYAVSVQVLNDTQARVDAEALENANQGVPAPLRNDAKVNPYSSSFARYGRGGAPR